MSTITITIGWTVHPSDLAERIAAGYSPYMDTYKPGQPQHTETITVEHPDAENVSGYDVADSVFYATNAPFVAADTLAGLIAQAISDTGYRGQGAHYSLSVGDTVTVGGVTYGCASEGWEII